jgi:hypothetical protein
VKVLAIAALALLSVAHAPSSDSPHWRLSRAFVSFNPVTRERTTLEDWTNSADAQATEAKVHALLKQFAPASAGALSRTPVYMARLYGASGYTAEEPHDPNSFVLYADPFRATSPLHLAATLVHELAHVERYRGRGFHANRAAAVLSRGDFILLGAADEMAAFRTEAAFLAASTPRLDLSDAEMRWPRALAALLSQDPRAARVEIVLDMSGQAARYWHTHHRQPLPSALEESIRSWVTHSPEWRKIAAQRAEWLAAGAAVANTPSAQQP